MDTWVNLCLLLILLSNLYLVGSSRLVGAIKMLAWQGVLLAALILFENAAAHPLHAILLAAASLLIKGLLMPYLLLTAMREVRIRREIEPYISQTLSLLLGAAMICTAFWLGSRLVLPLGGSSPLWVPTALSGLMIGLFLLVARRKAVTQVLGYLVLENGIVVFATAMVHKLPFAVEIGILLDVFAGVFIMGIMLNHIRDVFDDLDTDNLAMLKD